MIPKHLSHSQVKMYEECPRKWHLAKVQQAEETQTWYLPIGTAVHRMIEDWHDGIGVEPSSAARYFFPLITEQRYIQPDTSKWLKSGPEAAPYTEERALRLVEECFERFLEAMEDFTIWEVEYDCTGTLLGCQVPIRGFVDIIGEHKKHGPAIVDSKTGASKPNNDQLEVYSALLRLSPLAKRADPKSAQFKTGFYLMLNPVARKDAWGRKIDLSQVNPGQIGSRYQKAYEGMKRRLFDARTSGACKSCFFQGSCIEFAGPTPQALHYDKLMRMEPPF